jgi:hypothetical protein
MKFYENSKYILHYRVTSYVQTWSFAWSKVGGRMPDRAKYLDFNRVVEIENIQYEDEGTYECIVKRKSSVASKTVLLAIECKMYTDTIHRMHNF